MSHESTDFATPSAGERWCDDVVNRVAMQLTELRDQMLSLEREVSDQIESIPHDQQPSARNLLHYVALRRHDIRQLQETLVTLGLSSLGRCEAYVMANVNSVLSILERVCPNSSIPQSHSQPSPEEPSAVSFSEARTVLRRRTRRLLGVDPTVPAIMVTMPSEAADDYPLVHDLVAAGMVVMRVNCAHDDEAAWQGMIDNLRRAEAELGRSCRVAMDLAGPKIRTGPIRSKDDSIVLRKSDRLILTDETQPGRREKIDRQGQVLQPARIGCSFPSIFRDVRPGQRVLFDDGKIATEVVENRDDELLLEVTRAKKKGARLKAFKGINLPDSELDLPALTEKDLKDLEFIAANADIVSYSFVRRPADVRDIHRQLVRLGRPDLPVILKIENPQSFENLPLLLLESMRDIPAVGVMVARGDLAVECGWERLVEVQEEILWMCEAAHVPVVWATQVLEGLAKKGLPTRAELTDAGAGSRAECVMLNKGPNIVEAVECLYDILIRMHEHQTKKRPTFRRLKVADRILSIDDA